MKHKTGTRTLSLLLTLVMLLGMLPAISVPALAAGTNEAGEDVFQVVLADGTQLELTEDELRAEAESHIDDEGDPVTIDGTTLTWADYKSMLAIMDLQDILNDESVQNASLYDEEHMPYTQSLMNAVLGAPTLAAAANEPVETAVKLTKKGTNSYTIDTTNTTMSLGKAYNLPSYYIEDDSVESSSVSVDAEALDFTTFDSLGEVKLTVSWAGRVKDDTTGNYHATVNLTAERVLAEGATAEGTAEAVISYTIYESSGSDPVTGTITIPAGEAKKELKNANGEDNRIHLKEWKSGSKEASGLPGAAYVRYTPVSGCVLSTDDNGNPVNGASCILGNDYNSVWAFGLQEGDVTGTQSGWRARASTFGADRMRLAPSNANDVSEINYTIKMSTLRGRDTRGATRFRLSINTDYCSNGPITSVSDSNATMTVTVRESNSSGKVLYTTTTNAGSLPSFDWINFSSMSADDVYVSYKLSSGHFNRYEQGYSNPDERLYIQAQHNLTVQVAKNSEFSAAIPAGSGTVFTPGDAVPILVRSTAPAVSGDRSKITATVTYNVGNTTKSETITGAAAVHSDCAILFNWTMPQDCTAGTVKISNLKYGDNSNTAVEDYTEQSANCNVNYSNKLASFDIANASTALTDNGELAIKLPVRNNKNDWWNWIATEVGKDFIKETDPTRETALNSMYATFGSSAEHQPIYVHGDKTNETIDYAYIKLPDGQLNAVHIWVDGKEAFYSDGRYFIAGLSAASVEFPVKETTLPEGQTYYTLADSAKNASGVADLRIDYDSVWNHFAGNDGGTDTVAADSVTKLVPPRYEEYITDHNSGTPLTLSYTTAEKNAATNKKYSFVKVKYFSWESSDTGIATIENKTVTVNGVERVNGVVNFVGNTGEVTFTLVCTNGKHPVAVTSAKLNVSDSPDPYLYVPSTSNPVVTRQGMAATVRFVTNIAQRNSSLEGNNENTTTTYSIEVKDSGNNSVYTATETGSLSQPLSFITIPEKGSDGNVILNNIGAEAYTATVTAVYTGDAASLGTATSYTGEAGAYVFSATTNITVKAAPATVEMTLPKNLNEEESNFVMDTGSPVVSWAVKSNTPSDVKWKYEVTDSSGTKVASANGTGVSTMPTSWNIPKTDASKLKEIYTITVYVTNDEAADGWTVASTRMYVYNGDVLDILIHSSEHLAPGATADSAKLDNRELLRKYLSDDKKSLNLSQISLAELQHDVNLSTVISLNFGDYAWGNISDQIKWSAKGEPEDAGILYYHQASQYVALEDLTLDSVFPTSDLLEQGLKDGTVHITATHAGTGQQTSVDIDIDRVEDVFYLFQFLPKAVTEVRYKDGTGKDVTVTTNDQGQLALFEENGIDNTYPIYLSSTADVTYLDEKGAEQVTKDVPFVGMIEPGELVSGEVDNVEHELYPINKHTLASPGQVGIYIQKPDGTPLTNTSVTYRGGAFYGGTYAARADIFTAENRTHPYLGDENTSNGLTDAQKTTNANGALEFFFNVQQVADGELDYSKDIEYVFELRVNGYRPAIARIHPYQSSDVTITLRAEKSAKQTELEKNGVKIDDLREPFTNQIILYRYTAGGAEKIDLLPETGSSAKVGPNGQYVTAALEYETILWNYGGLIETDAASGQSKLKKNSLTQYFYDTEDSGNKTTLGKGYTVRNKSQTSEVWVYPFSTVPIATTMLTMDKDCFGVTETGEKTGSTWLAKYKWTGADVYLYDGSKSVKQLPFEYGIFNGVGMNEVTHSREAMRQLQSAINGIADDMTTFRLTDDGVNMNADDFLNPMIDLLNGVMNNGEGFRIEPYFAATADPTTYYVFMNMKKDTVSNIVDSVIGGSDPGDELSDYIESSSQYGISPSYEDYEKMFEKFDVAKDEEGNPVTLDSFANRHLQGTLDFGGGGAMLLRAEYDPELKLWHLYYLSGSFDMFLQVGYSKHFYVDGIAIGIGAEVGVDKLYMASNHYDTGNIQRHDLIRQLSIGGGIECFVGQGFSCIVTYELGIVGQVKFTSSNSQMTSTLAHANSDGSDKISDPIKGNKKSITGRIALRLTVGVLLFEKTWDLASTKFELANWTNDNYTKLRNTFEGKATYNQTYSNGTSKTLSAKYTAVPTEDGQVLLTFETEKLDTRQFLAAVNTGETIYKTYTNGSSVSNVVLSDDGKSVFYLDDNTASWASADGSAKGSLIDLDSRTQLHDEDSVGDYGHFYLDASGSGSNLFAAWSTQTQSIQTETRNDDSEEKGTETFTEEVTAEDLGAALNSTEITVAVYNGSAWTVKNLTRDSTADVSPKIAGSGNKAIVAWIGGASSGTASSKETDDPIFNATNFDVDSKILFSRYDGSSWSAAPNDSSKTPGIVVNTATLGNISGMDVAMLSDGTALVAYSVQTDPTGNPNGQEVYYSLIAPNGTVTTNRATENNAPDGNVKVQAVGSDEFVLAWYAGDGDTESNNANGDIRLLGIKKDGQLDEKIPESIAVDEGNRVVSAFDMAGSSLSGLTIAWPLTEEMTDDAIVSSGALYGVQLYSDGSKTVVSPAQKLGISSGKNVAVDSFQMAVNGQSVDAVLTEKDYTASHTVTYELNYTLKNTEETGTETVVINVGDDRLERKTDTFKDPLEITDILYNQELVAPNTELPLWFTVRNMGTHKITKLTLNSTAYNVTLYPGESTTISTAVTFGAGVTDYNYTLSATSDGNYSSISDTIRFNVPEVSIQDMAISAGDPGERTVSVQLSNRNELIPLSGSGKALSVGLYADAEGTKQLAVPVVVNSSNDLTLVDKSSLNVNLTTTMEQVNTALARSTTDDIPESGVPVYAIAEVKDGSTTVSSTMLMTSILPLSTSAEDEDGRPIEAQLEYWEQDEETQTVKTIVSYTNPSLEAQNLSGLTRISVYDANGLLVAERFVPNDSTQSIAGESTAYHTFTVELPKGTTVSLVEAETVDVIEFSEKPEVSGYQFNGWYVDEEYKNSWAIQKKLDEEGKEVTVNGAEILDADGNPVLDEEGKPTYEQIPVFEPNVKDVPELAGKVIKGTDNSLTFTPDDKSVAFTIYARWSRISVSYNTNTVRVEVSGDEGSISVSASVNGNTATVTAPTNAQMAQILDKNKETGSIVVDLSSLDKKVTAVSIPAKAIKAFDEAVEDGQNGLTIKLPNSTVTFDPEALTEIAKQTTGSDLKLTAEPIAENKLNAKQREVVADLNVQVVYDIYLTSGGKKISDFGDGKASIQISYTLKDGQRPGGIIVWYVADDGVRAGISTTATEKTVSWTVTHFSNYLVAYDETLPGACSKDDTCPISAFTDADPTAWYHDGVHYALENGIMLGNGDGTFTPNSNTTRAMMAQILWNMEDKPAVNYTMSYTDVESGVWYAEAVRWATAKGIMSGYGGGKFGPNNSITREQLVTIMYRFAQYKGVNVSVGEDTNILSYDDALTVSEYAVPAMQWAVGSGLVTGRTATTLNPKDNATRAEIATIVMRYCVEIAG